jgi:phage terminase large subunit
MAELFMQNGVPLIKSDNNRVQGHMILKDMMAPRELTDPYVKSLYKGKAPDTLPGIIFFTTCDRVISDIKSIQADDKNPNDCAKEPHDITHCVDAARYFAVTRTLSAEAALPEKEIPDEFIDETGEDYETYMCGTGDGSYLTEGL